MPRKFEQDDERYYVRQLLLPNIGIDGQKKIAGSSVTIVGVGGLGSPVALYLAAAGVGRLKIIDPDQVNDSNLNRQILHWREDSDKASPKVRSASQKLNRLNPGVEVIEEGERLDEKNVKRLLADSDIIVDCLDNYHSRFILNDHCIKMDMPLVHAAVEGWRGQATTIVPGETPCLSCLLDKPPKSEEGTIPILGAVAGVFGSIQAVEVIKLICGMDGILKGRLLLGDLSDHTWDVIELLKRPDCRTCGNGR
jgi:molybdopterin/thiamine biosynthesis adenylyltransferase